MARIAMTFALQALCRAVTKSRSLWSRSFHHPSRPENVAAGHFARPDLLAIDDDDVTAEAGVPALDADLKEEQIALYERAIPHIERALGLPPQTH